MVPRSRQQAQPRVDAPVPTEKDHTVVPAKKRLMAVRHSKLAFLANTRMWSSVPVNPLATCKSKSVSGARGLVFTRLPWRNTNKPDLLCLDLDETAHKSGRTTQAVQRRDNGSPCSNAGTVKDAPFHVGKHGLHQTGGVIFNVKQAERVMSGETVYRVAVQLAAARSKPSPWFAVGSCAM